MPKEKDRNSILIIELDHIKDKLVDYKIGAKGHWDEKKKVFLESPKFYDLLGDHSAFLFEMSLGGGDLYKVLESICWNSFWRL